MEKNNKCVGLGFSRILWTVVAILLCAAPTVQAKTCDGGGTYDLAGTINENVFIEDDGTIVNFNACVPSPFSVYVCFYGSTGATLNFGTDAHAYYVEACPGSYVNLYDGTVDYAISVIAGANVKVYGASFTVAGDPTVHYPGETLPSIDAVLTAYDADGGQLFTGRVSCGQGASISLEAAGGGPVPVDIDIKPGSDPNPINPGSNGLIPVAILTTADFDAADVDPATVTLAGAEVAVRGKADKLMARLEDVDGDGDNDLLLQVETQSEGTLWESGTVTLTGKTYDGQDIEGTDEVIIVPAAE